jgi:hypothetical protein
MDDPGIVSGDPRFPLRELPSWFGLTPVPRGKIGYPAEYQPQDERSNHPPQGCGREDGPLMQKDAGLTKSSIPLIITKLRIFCT